jgi:hypothetical protein
MIGHALAILSMSMLNAAAGEYYGNDPRDRAGSMRHLLAGHWIPTHSIVSDAVSQVVSLV